MLKGTSKDFKLREMPRYFSFFFLQIPNINMSCPQLNSKNNGPGLLFKTLLWLLFCFQSFVATHGKDGNRLKLEKVGLNFSSFDAVSTKKKQKIYYGTSGFKTFH